MTSEENKTLVRRYYEEVVNTGNVDRISEYVSPDYVEVYNGVEYPKGLQGAKEHVLGIRKTFPDLKLTIELQVSEGNWVVTQIVAEGTHEGAWLGMKPTREKVRLTAVNIDRVANGLIVEHGGAANLLEPLLSMGAIRINDPVGE